MRTRAALVIAGVLIMGYAAGGALTDPGLDPGGVLLFLAGVLIGHDVLWMPAVLAAGAAVHRLTPQRHRPAVTAAAICAAGLTLVGLPLVLGFGRAPDNPSVLPLPYGRNLVAVLLVVAAGTLPALLRSRPATGRKKSERSAGTGADRVDR